MCPIQILQSQFSDPYHDAMISSVDNSILFAFGHVVSSELSFGASTCVPPRDQLGVAALLPAGAVVALQPVAAAVRRGTPEARPEVGLSEATEFGRGIARHLQCKWIRM